MACRKNGLCGGSKNGLCVPGVGAAQGVSASSPLLLREGHGSAIIRSNDSLCFPRGHAVDHWEGELHLASSAVPPHPGACAPGWKGSGMFAPFRSFSRLRSPIFGAAVACCDG